MKVKYFILFFYLLISVSTFSDQYVDAGSTKKVHFTQTITSSPDPGLGYENQQLALVLSPNEFSQKKSLRSLNKIIPRLSFKAYAN